MEYTYNTEHENTQWLDDRIQFSSQDVAILAMEVDNMIGIIQNAVDIIITQFAKSKRLPKDACEELWARYYQTKLKYFIILGKDFNTKPLHLRDLYFFEAKLAELSDFFREIVTYH